MKKANRTITHLLVFDIGGVARRIEGDVRREVDVSRPMHLPEALETRIKRNETSLRESHHRDARGVDSLVLREQLERTIGIHDHGQAPEPGLVRYRLDDAPPGKAI